MIFSIDTKYYNKIVNGTKNKEFRIETDDRLKRLKSGQEIVLIDRKTNKLLLCKIGEIKTYKNFMTCKDLTEEEKNDILKYYDKEFLFNKLYKIELASIKEFRS